MRRNQIALALLRIMALLVTLTFYGCTNTELSTIYRNLPTDLQETLTTCMKGEKAVLCKISQPFSAVSLAVSNNGVYAIVNDGGTSVWRAEGTTKWIALGGTRTLRGVATSGDGRVVHAWDTNSVWQLRTGEGSWQRVGNSPGKIHAIGVSVNGETVYARTNDGLWRWKEGDTQWQLVEPEVTFTEISSYEAQLESIWALGPGIVYEVASTPIYDSRGDPAGLATDLVSWSEEQGWQSMDWNMGNVAVDRLMVSGDGADIFALTTEGNLWTRGRQWPIDQELINFGITTLMYDPNQHGVLYVGTKKGLYLTRNSGLNWEPVEGPGQGRAINAIVYHPRWQVPLVATNNGVYFLIHRQEQQTSFATKVWSAVTLFYDENHSRAWFWPVTTLGGFLTTYILGMISLLLLAWQAGSTIFSRTWLNSIATKPLLITPGLGRWVLFLGYKRRLTKLKALVQASKDYFGLPAEDLTGSFVLPDPTGDALHQHISEVLGPQQPVLIIGKGGAGKSTLLARWAYLALNGQLPAPLKGFRPVLLPASYYGGNLVKAIADTLRERDGVAVNEEIMRAQLQSGKLLILFDGITEVEGDKQQSLQEILRTARDADFQRCRFLIATRPLDALPTDVFVFHLQPLSPSVISVLLPRYRLGSERENQIRHQLQSFGDKPLEPLIFVMALAQNDADGTTTNRAQLYERYLRRLLQVEREEILWGGWRTALETIAQWSLLNTGRRGVGLHHEILIDHMSEKASGTQATEGFVEYLQRYYHLPLKNELDLLKQLEAAGILQSGRRWHFAHDTFEEYYAASYLVSQYDHYERWPKLDKWLETDEQQREFLNVIGFVGEMVDESTKQHLLALDLPSVWKDYLNQA